MPDRTLPRSWRIAARIARAFVYAAVLAAAAAGVVWTPATIIGTIGEPLTLWWVAFAGVGALAAIVGLVIDDWRVEWVSMWPMAGGILGYAVAIWGMVGGGETTRATQGFIVTALCAAVLHRSLELGAHAAMLRAESGLSRWGRRRTER